MDYKNNTRTGLFIFTPFLKCCCNLIPKTLWLIFFIFIGLIIINNMPLKVYAQNIDQSNSSSNQRTFIEQMDFVYNNLEILSRSESKNIFKKYDSIVAKEVNIENLYSTNSQELKRLLDRAVYESVDVLSLFTLPVLLKKENRALVLDREVLKRINRTYNLHALFLISSETSDDKKKIQMNFLVTGQGKLIVSYDNNLTITHPDYSIATGKYDYLEFFVMDAKRDDNGNPGLFNIRGISGPLDNFKSMRGPLNAVIKSLCLMSGTGAEKKTIVNYEFLGANKTIVPCIPIEIKSWED